MIQGLGERLQKLRKERRLSQKELAKVLGVSAGIISNYESSERTPSLENLIALATFYRCSTDYLLGLDKTEDLPTIDASPLTKEQRILLQSFVSSLK